MRKPTFKEAWAIAGAVILVCAILRGWDAIIAFIGIVLTAIIPLVLGAAIAYVVAIPTRFLERYFLPNSNSKLVSNIRRPVCVGITVILILAVLAVSSSVLIPALVDTVTMVQTNGQAFVESVIQHPLLRPIREAVHNFITGDFVTDLTKLDINGVIKSLFGGTVGSVTTQVFTVVSTVMTGFFGMLFSFILLTDTTDVGYKLANVIACYLGSKRMERLALVAGVADASFHNFIVRQCIEASILGSVGTVVLVAAGYPYALGVGVLMGLAALVPIVGYPIGLFVGAFMVVINNAWIALLYLVCVAVTQMLESTFLLPHVGDPRTALPPVWVTVAVTIGGGVGGFLGMLLAIPLAATVRQLVLIDMHRRVLADETQNADMYASAGFETGEVLLSQSLKDGDGDGVGKVE